MIHLMWYEWLYLAFIPVVCLLLGSRSNSSSPGTRQTWVDYFLARSQLSVGSTLSNYLGANLVFTAIFLVLTLEAYRRGWWVLAVPCAWLIGTALLIWIYPRLVPFLDRGETLHQALGSVFDGGRVGWRSVRTWASLWTIVAFVSGVGLEFYGGVLLLQWAGVPLLSSMTLATILALVCASFTVVGGLRGVARVNMFLDAVSFVGIGVVFWFIHQATAGPTVSALQRTPAPDLGLADNLTFAVAALLIFCPLQLCALDTWQRGVAWKAKSRRQVAIPLFVGGALIALAAYIAILAGTLVRDEDLSPGVHPLLALLTYINFPPPILGLVIGGFFAAILSTADELLSCCGYAFLADFLKLPRSTANPDIAALHLKTAKFYTALFAFAAALFAWAGLSLQKQITDLANVAFATQVVFFLPLLVAFFHPRAAQLGGGVLIAMLLAFATSVTLTLATWFIWPQRQEFVDGAPIAAFVVSLLAILATWGYVSRRRGAPTVARPL